MDEETVGLVCNACGKSYAGEKDEIRERCKIVHPCGHQCCGKMVTLDMTIGVYPRCRCSMMEETMRRNSESKLKKLRRRSVS